MLDWLAFRLLDVVAWFERETWGGITIEYLDGPHRRYRRTIHVLEFAILRVELTSTLMSNGQHWARWGL